MPDARRSDVECSPTHGSRPDLFWATMRLKIDTVGDALKLVLAGLVAMGVRDHDVELDVADTASRLGKTDGALRAALRRLARARLVEVQPAGNGRLRVRLRVEQLGASPACPPHAQPPEARVRDDMLSRDDVSARRHVAHSPDSDSESNNIYPDSDSRLLSSLQSGKIQGSDDMSSRRDTSSHLARHAADAFTAAAHRIMAPSEHDELRRRAHRLAAELHAEVMALRQRSQQRELEPVSSDPFNLETAMTVAWQVTVQAFPGAELDRIRRTARRLCEGTKPFTRGVANYVGGSLRGKFAQLGVQWRITA